MMSYFELIDARMSRSEKEQPVQASGRRWTRSLDCKNINWKHQDFFPRTFNSDKMSKKSLGLDR